MIQTQIILILDPIDLVIVVVVVLLNLEKIGPVV